jgi:hypothetical protein
MNAIWLIVWQQLASSGGGAFSPRLAKIISELA